MKNYLWIISLLLLLSNIVKAIDYNFIGYEFLTPKVLVLKTVKQPFFSKAAKQQILQSGIWYKENALKRSKDGKILRKADITCFTYLILKKPFNNNEVRKIGNFNIKYSPNKPTNLFKLNQIGNGINQKQKFAYLGFWLGSLGPLKLNEFVGKEFQIIDATTNQCVYKNVITKRVADTLYQGKTPFIGEEVLELDYSKFNTPGKYYFYIQNIGRSINFIIDSQAINEAFYIHARALYHKRCGIEKKLPYTYWTSPKCHKAVYLGRFPSNDEHYLKGKGEKEFGFFDKNNKRIEVKHFELIKSNPHYNKTKIPAIGGWHDAADYDRRPYHLNIVNDLALTYLLKPQNFIDNQLNIPESSNQIPDILDECIWGLKHLLHVQQKDGGVATWFETTGHPADNEGLPDVEKRTYFMSTPSRNSSLRYAASASTLALALKQAGQASLAAKYQASAIKAWKFAVDKKNRLMAFYHLKGQVIFYKEEPYLNRENLLKAGANLYTLTKDEKYLTLILQDEKNIIRTMYQNFWKWSPLTWIALEIYPIAKLQTIRNHYQKIVTQQADKLLSSLHTAYPYRTLWYKPTDPWVHSMSWGVYHPLRKAMMLIAAHKITNKPKYLDAIYLANDFHNGANALSRSMTSNLGVTYPVVFLDLISYSDNIAEFVPGITPYGNTFGLNRNVIKLVYKENADRLPIFRRYVNLEFLSVPSSEYTIWETIAPAIVTTGYLIETPAIPNLEQRNKKPASNIVNLPGYYALP